MIDLDTREEVRFALADLPRHVEKFGFIVGVETRVFKDQDPVNILAAEIMGKLHDALKASRYEGHRLERLLVRLMFCLFADDTGIFDELGQFETFVRDRTREDGADLGALLSQFFEVLNTPPDQRQSNLDEDLARFPYINGDLFAEPLPIPAFDKAMRERLLEACGFSWEKISPAIFGALFQSVMNARERRAKGAHYTTEKNILKVIEPLFLDDLRADLARVLALKRGRKAALEAFHDKLAGLKLFDPACGCGNFLIIAYRELRILEIEVLNALYPDGYRDLDASTLSRVDVDQFYGIEIDEFPTRIAETAMWMMDHIMNNRLSQEFGQVFARIPLKAAPHIVHGDALEVDWGTVLAPEECSYVLGNPPFIGFVMRGKNQQAQAGALMARLGAAGSRLDYVAAWFLKAGQYLQNSRGRIAFVSTNSITQGEQVSQLWPALFERWGLEIIFAHRTFAWGSDARGKAHVHVVVVGLSRLGDEPAEKRLFSYPDVNGNAEETRHGALSPYLFDASTVVDKHLVVHRTRTSLAGKPKMCVGSKPVDDGHYIFDEEQRASFLAREPRAEPILRPFVGGREHIGGEKRWILCPQTVTAQELRSLPAVMDRVAAVRAHRTDAGGPLGRSLARTPTQFHVTVLPDAPFLAIAEVSSSRREYVPIGWLNPPTVPSNKILVVKSPSLSLFGQMTSAMHMAWLSQIGGRMKSDFSYSTGLVYNTFPWPIMSKNEDSKLSNLAQSILDVRDSHFPATLADLYDPDTMPADLRRAHRALDLAVDRLYRKTPFESDRERVEHLFGLYERMTAGLLASAKPKGRRRKA